MTTTEDRLEAAAIAEGWAPKYASLFHSAMIHDVRLGLEIVRSALIDLEDLGAMAEVLIDDQGNPILPSGHFALFTSHYRCEPRSAPEGLYVKEA
jgi:hypothetical protein